MTDDDAMQMLEELNAKHNALRAAVEAKLKWYEEREPLVQRLVGLADPPYDDGKLPTLRDCGRAVRDFKLT